MNIREATIMRVLPNARALVSTVDGNDKVMTFNPQYVPLVRGKKVYINDSREIVHVATKKTDIWNRANEEEIEIILADFEEGPLKDRLIFNEIQEISHMDEFYTKVKEKFIRLFGEERATELLRESE